jgi:AcrR family transcriptional regulator
LVVPRKPLPDVEEKILAAAVELMYSQGIVGLKVRDVAQRSGTTVAMVYRRFIDRDGLLDAAVASFYESRINHIVAVAEELADREGAITIQDFVDVLPMPEYPGSYEIHTAMSRVPALASESDAFRTRIQRFIERRLPDFRSAVERAVARLPEHDQFDSRVITVLLLNQSWMFNDLRGDQRISNDEYREFLLDLLSTARRRP